ncbi:hypothetical protein PSU4_59220 [Pseudonocardia sulfidoxydans NBRC 16205]|uniref:Uncharacterized protein n=1 Tax=Pseudonocardia sulfidoxydans NBRC 16205 TaxID=1223511 RepID=A0A511DV40_9PSEU|nr:hypothetical protein PSU4_59220 [Pseudonocardia sulfidoxydans NBRC 16205]
MTVYVAGVGGVPIDGWHSIQAGDLAGLWIAVERTGAPAGSYAVDQDTLTPQSGIGPRRRMPATAPPRFKQFHALPHLGISRIAGSHRESVLRGLGGPGHV